MKILKSIFYLQLLEDNLVTQYNENFPWRIFVSMNVPYIIGKELSEIKNLVPDSYKHLLKWVDLSLIHCTLIFIGDSVENQVISVREVIENLKFDYEINTFVEEFGFLPNQNHPNVFIAKLNQSPEMFHLYNQLRSKLLENNFKLQKKFIPHITIARIRKNYSKKELKSFISFFQKMEYLKKISFQFKKISVIRSILKTEGPDYKILSEISIQSDNT
ncbi:MAG: RNA 2',3'-cyclic phosphodiesterase [Dehalococcoidia bacterium]|nr:RNA 2',3'-cyclic phosphodiesterase [Dehalococcoidia bacterium]